MKPLRYDNTKFPIRDGKLCKCNRCGIEHLSIPGNDFYTGLKDKGKEKAPLFCKECVKKEF